MKHRREDYIPPEAVAVDPEGTDAAVYHFGYKGCFCVVAFRGNAKKPGLNEYCREPEMRDYLTSLFIADRRRLAEAKAEIARERKTPHTLKVGDILVDMWGYEQTNVDFYQVTKLVGKTMVEIRPVRKEKINETADTGTCTPRKGDFYGDKVLRRRANGGNQVRIEPYSRAHRWDGKPEHWTSYA